VQTSYLVSYIFYHILKMMSLIILNKFKVTGGFKGRSWSCDLPAYAPPQRGLFTDHHHPHIPI
jgi:hypothetical protein